MKKQNELYAHEQYITQRHLKNGWSFQVYIKYKNTKIVKSFNESDYNSARTAYNEAVYFKHEQLNKIRKNHSFFHYGKSLEELFEEMQEFSASSPETKRKEKSTFRNYIEHKDKILDDITSADIQESMNHCAERGSKDNVDKSFALWRNLYKYAVLKDYIEIDRTTKVIKPKPKKLVTKRNVYCKEEDLEIIFELFANRKRNKKEGQLISLLLRLLKVTGARPGEILALRRSDVHEGYIEINKWMGTDEDRHAIIRNTKTEESFRRLPISSKMRTVLDELLAFSDNEQLFEFPDGELPTTGELSAEINKFVKKHGYEFTMYMLRHRSATIWNNARIDDRTFSDLMGHKKPANMNTYYAQPSDELKLQALELL